MVLDPPLAQFNLRQRNQYAFMQFLSDKIKSPYPVIDGLKAVNLDLVIRDKAPVIVDFYAHWCRPCQQFMPTFQLANALVPEITFIKVWTIPYGFYVFFVLL